MKVQWKDLRKKGKYYINRIFADLPCTAIPEDDPYVPTFTIAPEHHDGLYSMEQLFMEHYNDPTEYSFVQDVFEGDLDHWEAVKDSQWLSRHYRIWKKRAEAMLVSEAMKKIVSTAFDDNNKNSFQALKYLVEKDNKTTKKATAGRPKKEKAEEEVDNTDLMADIARLRG
jgi:hypothetical protein